MKRASAWFWPILLLLTSQILRATDDAVIYPAGPATAHSSSKAVGTVTHSSNPASPSSDDSAPVTAQVPTPVAAPSAPTPVAAAPEPVAQTPAPVQYAPSRPAPNAVASPPSSGKTYTVKAGDNLWRIGKAHGTTLEAIKALNGMTSDAIHVGQVLMLPVAGFTYHPAQPGQVLPTPSPMPVSTPTLVLTPVAPNKALPAVSPQPTAPAPSLAQLTPQRPNPQPQPVAVALPVPAPQSSSNATSTTMAAPAPAPLSRPLAQLPARQLTYTEAQSRLIAESQNLAKLDIGFDESWTPPGENHSWDMDCSNTSRYLYKKALGIELPRTASDQYYNLKLQNIAWDVPTDSNDRPDVDYLKRNLRVGDLLFWENTYKPERDPPITHVTIYIGTDAKGNMLMAGSQSSDIGMYGQHRGGPNVYLFDPLKNPGGYSTWLGFVHKKGRFVAFGRPLAQTPNLAASR